MQKGLAYIFPAFTLKYTGKEMRLIRETGFDLEQRISESGRTLGLNIEDFDLKENNYLQSELENQILSYIFSCTFGDLLREKGEEPELVSGFSMGLYAALYHSRAVDFRTGLFLIRDIYTQVRTILGSAKYTMASVVGFSLEDLRALSAPFPSVEAVIQNGMHSFVLSGTEADIEALLPLLREEGAIHLSRFNLSSAYHAKVLQAHTRDFEKVVNRYPFEEARISVFSMIDLEKRQSVDELKREIVRNVSRPLNFYDSLLQMNGRGIRTFVEVGAGTALLKSSKFIEGDFEFIAVAKGRYGLK
jgi:malonyl CoA-acyl carrier protein transacylase